MRRKDLARGRIGLFLWGAPIALLLLTFGVGSLAFLTSDEAGVLLVVGTAWLGATCLVNALRCGRLHCWIDGLGLPVLALVGVLILFRFLTVSWNSFGTALWIIVAVSFGAEGILGPYLAREPSGG